MKIQMDVCGQENGYSSKKVELNHTIFLKLKAVQSLHLFRSAAAIVLHM